MSDPDRVPSLVDAEAGVTVRAIGPADVDAIVEQCRDPEMVRWTQVPDPYARSDAEEFLAKVGAGWRSGDTLTWAIAADRDGRTAYCGSIDLRITEASVAEIGFGLHPGARGRSIMSTAVRLVRDYAFSTAGIEVLRWRAVTGNWASRRVAAAAGFAHEGTVRGLLVHRGTPVDGWIATLTASDARDPQPWLTPAELSGAQVRLRAFRDDDADRIAEACGDPRTQHWLVSLPRPYGRDDALRYLETTRELAASAAGVVWCVADPANDACLGAISLDGLGSYAPRGEIGYWAHPGARGRGVITEAVRLVAAYTVDSGLASALIIRCAAENTASRHAAHTAGFREVGVLTGAEPVGDGSLSDLVLYAHP